MLFGAEKIQFEEIGLLEKNTPNLLIYFLPAVILFTVIEYLFSHYGDHKHYEQKETVGSVLVGLGNLFVNLILKMALLYGSIWIYNLLPWRMELNWWTLPVCLIIYDFSSYWSHRISHYNRFFWATHVVHHSASHYNLTVAFRQSWVQHFKIVFFIPAVLVGFHPVIFFITSQLSTLYQFWVHTETIGKLHPWIERYFGTPSNHRVHHGSQEKYLDKNFGATFMIWDHLFGSFQYEEEQPIYGLTTPLEDKINPFTLNFHEYSAMIKDVKESTTWRERLFYIFASPARIYQKKLHQKTPSFKKEPIDPIKKDTWEQIIRIVGISLFFLFSAQQSVPAFGIDKKVQEGYTRNLQFYRQKNIETNTVIYELNYKEDGTLRQEEPVKSTWIRYTEQNPQRNFTATEKRYALGVRSKYLGNDEYEIRLIAYKQLPLYIKRSEIDNKYKIYIKDEGQNYLLKRVFVSLGEQVIGPSKIRYIDLIAINSGNGPEILQRINI